MGFLDMGTEGLHALRGRQRQRADFGIDLRVTESQAECYSQTRNTCIDAIAKISSEWWQRIGFARIRPAQYREKQRNIFNGARHWPAMTKRAHRARRKIGHASQRRLDAGHTAKACRNPD